jgi:hypothetical protein
MASVHLCAVEFVGGPFDGHVYMASFPPEELANMTYLPVNHNMFLMLEGRTPGPKAPATSVAVYELEGQDSGDWRYCFLGAMAANDVKYKSWVG